MENCVFCKIIKGEIPSPIRVEAILKCLREGGGTPVFPKRNYKFKGDK